VNAVLVDHCPAGYAPAAGDRVLAEIGGRLRTGVVLAITREAAGARVEVRYLLDSGRAVNRWVDAKKCTRRAGAARIDEVCGAAVASAAVRSLRSDLAERGTSLGGLMAATGAELSQRVAAAGEAVPCRRSDEPERWFPVDQARAADEDYARSLCAGCPVLAECLALGLRGGEAGIWGGTTEGRRRLLRRADGGLRIGFPGRPRTGQDDPEQRAVPA
jgi:WhiB family redox-sensing transcriptional regulator